MRVSVIFVLAASAATASAYTFDESQAFLKQYCAACHSGSKPAGNFRVAEVASDSAFMLDDRWTRVLSRVRSTEMPPKGAPSPDLAARETFVKWLESSLHQATCATSPAGGPAPIRRLNRGEYTATVRELLNIHLDVGHDLPADGAGGQGFDNAAEVLVLSPLLAEKYLDAAKQAVQFALRDSRARARLGITEPSAKHPPNAAARKVLAAFLPRAFRRPVREAEMEPFLSLFRAAQRNHENFDDSIGLMLRGVLMSPDFLFIAVPVNAGKNVRPLDDYALATRLSYFLWGSMPDEMLFDLASMGKLHEHNVLKEEVGRMLRSGKSMEFVNSFVSQWLGTRILSREFAPDSKLFPKYASDAELRADIAMQPNIFFQTLFANNAPLTDLLDSNWTIMTGKLVGLYGFDKKQFPRGTGQQPERVELPPNSHRGGVLGMSAVLAISSYPYRTSPVLRGKWVLDALLGTPPPPPPPNVPSLDEHPVAAQPSSIRERLARHRADPACASCHSRIDPLGFALENYDALGQWRTEDSGKPVDNVAEFPDGTKFAGPDELRALLLSRKDQFLHSFAARMLGYALGRSLNSRDMCAVDDIVSQIAKEGNSSQALIQAIVTSPVFRNQSPAL